MKILEMKQGEINLHLQTIIILLQFGFTEPLSNINAYIPKIILIIYMHTNNITALEIYILDNEPLKKWGYY